MYILWTHILCSFHTKMEQRTPLVVQWWRIHLPMQGTMVQSLIRELSPHTVGQWSATITQQRPSIPTSLKKGTKRKKDTRVFRLIHASNGIPREHSRTNLSARQEPQKTQVPSLGRENPLEEGMATHSSIPACTIPWTEEPGRLQSMGLQSWKWLSMCKQVIGSLEIFSPSI